MFLLYCFEKNSKIYAFAITFLLIFYGMMWCFCMLHSLRYRTRYHGISSPLYHTKSSSSNNNNTRNNTRSMDTHICYTSHGWSYSSSSACQFGCIQNALYLMHRELVSSKIKQKKGKKSPRITSSKTIGIHSYFFGVSERVSV